MNTRTTSELTPQEVTDELARMKQTTAIMQQMLDQILPAMQVLQADGARSVLRDEVSLIAKCMEFLPEFAGGKVTPDAARTKVEAAVTIARQIRAAAQMEIQLRARSGAQ
jgi:hypothetical protein